MNRAVDHSLCQDLLHEQVRSEIASKNCQYSCGQPTGLRRSDVPCMPEAPDVNDVPNLTRILVMRPHEPPLRIPLLLPGRRTAGPEFNMPP